jgi:hypothetical protein
MLTVRRPPRATVCDKTANLEQMVVQGFVVDGGS